jgi:CRP-like cAMP-binding protein
MKSDIIKLTPKQIKFLRRDFELLKFTSDSDLVYELQIPNTGIVLISGELSLFQKSKIHTTIQPGHLLGVKAIINSEPVEHGCKVTGDSELILLHKGDIMKALSDKDSELYAIIKEKIST